MTSSVTDPISGTSFQILRSSNPSDLQLLTNWVSDITARLDSDKFVTISFDTEGFLPPICIQFAEVYDDSFDLFSGSTEPPPVNPKPGFIILLPFSPEISALLTRIFNNDRVAILAFDFTQDVGLLENAKISVNLERLVDCQLSTVAPHKTLGFLGTTRVPGLARMIRDCDQNSDPLVSQAQEKVDKSIHWDSIEYLSHKGFSIDLTSKEEFLRYAAADITMTALTCTTLIRNGFLQDTVTKTRLKAAEFRDLRTKLENPYGPLFVRQMAFFKTYGLAGFQSFEITQEDIPIDEIPQKLKLWNWTTCIQNGFRMIENREMSQNVFCQLSPEIIEEKRMALERVLDQHIEEILSAGFSSFKEQADEEGGGLGSKEILRKEIIKRVSGSQQARLIQEASELPEGKVVELTEDPALLLEWIQRE